MGDALLYIAYLAALPGYFIATWGFSVRPGEFVRNFSAVQLLYTAISLAAFLLWIGILTWALSKKTALSILIAVIVSLGAAFLIFVSAWTAGILVGSLHPINVPVP